LIKASVLLKSNCMFYSPIEFSSIECMPGTRNGLESADNVTPPGHPGPEFSSSKFHIGRETGAWDSCSCQMAMPHNPDKCVLHKPGFSEFHPARLTH